MSGLGTDRLRNRRSLEMIMGVSTVVQKTTGQESVPIPSEMLEGEAVVDVVVVEMVVEDVDAVKALVVHNDQLGKP